MANHSKLLGTGLQELLLDSHLIEVILGELVRDELAHQCIVDAGWLTGHQGDLIDEPLLELHQPNKSATPLLNIRRREIEVLFMPHLLNMLLQIVSIEDDLELPDLGPQLLDLQV
jgi:hypothetical protein